MWLGCLFRQATARTGSMGLPRAGFELRAVNLAQLLQLGLRICGSCKAAAAVVSFLLVWLVLASQLGAIAGMAHTLNATRVAKLTHLGTPVSGSLQQQRCRLDTLLHHLHVKIVLTLLQRLFRLACGQANREQRLMGFTKVMIILLLHAIEYTSSILT